MVTATLPQHPLRSGATPATLWVALSILNIALPALTIGVALPWIARHHHDPTPLLYGLLVTLGVYVAALIADRRLSGAMRLHTPGAMADNPPAPRPADLAVSALESATLIGAILLARQSAMAMDAIGAFQVAIVLGLLGALIPLGVLRLYRLMRDRPSAWKVRSARYALRLIVEPSVALAVGWTILPSQFAHVGREFISFALVLAVVIVVVRQLLRRLAASRQGSGRPTVTAEGSSPRALLDGVADGVGDDVLSWVNPAPSLDERKRARRYSRMCAYVCVIVAAIGSVWLILAPF